MPWGAEGHKDNRSQLHGSEAAEGRASRTEFEIRTNKWRDDDNTGGSSRKNFALDQLVASMLRMTGCSSQEAGAMLVFDGYLKEKD